MNKHDVKRISRLISENVDEHYDDPAMDPAHFANAVNAVIAAAPHGQQGQALQRLIEIGQEDKGRLIDMLEKVEKVTDPTDFKYVQDFYRTKGSNIQILAKLAQIAYDNYDAVARVLDSLDLATSYEDSDDEDMYNSEGDGYSH